MKKIIISILVSLFIVWNSFAYTLNDWVKMIESVKAPEEENNLCDIINNNTKLVKFIWDYIIYNNETYKYEAYIDWNTGKDICKTNKIKFNVNIDLKTFKNLWWKYYQDKNWIYYFSWENFTLYLKILKLDNVDIQTFEVIDSFFEKAQDKNYLYIRWKMDKERAKLIKKDNITIDDFEIKNEKLTPWNKSKIDKIYWKIYDFSYESDIKTNMEWNFMWKINLWGGSSISNKLEEWKSWLYNKFYINDKTTIIEFTIDIYNKDKAEFSFQDWEKIWTIKRKIKFTTDMEKPEFVQEEQIHEKFNSNEKIYLLLEKFDKKLSKKSLKSKYNVYKNLNTKLKELKEKYKYWKNIKLINYLYETVHKKYLITFKEYILEKK